MKTLLTSGSAPPLEPDDPLPESAIAPALVRIGADHLPPRQGRLNVFRWFVDLSKLAIDALSPAELLAKREEYGALQKHLWHESKPYMPPLSDLEELIKDIARHIKQFVDTGSTSMGPFSVYIVVYDTRRYGTPPPWSKTGIVAGELKVGRVTRMLREMGELFEEFGAYVTRCPRSSCQNIFVKPRANADYCSRSCQNAHYMEKVRNADDQSKKPRVHKKGGRRHGKKKRT